MVHLFSNIVRRQIGARTPTVEYISSHSQILFMLLKGWVSRPQGIAIDQHFQKPLISLAFPIDVMGDCGCMVILGPSFSHFLSTWLSCQWHFTFTAQTYLVIDTLVWYYVLMMTYVVLCIHIYKQMWFSHIREITGLIYLFIYLLNAAMKPQKWPLTVAWCWGNVCVMNLWPESFCSLRSSTASFAMWSYLLLTLPLTPSPLLRYEIYTKYHPFCKFWLVNFALGTWKKATIH